MENRTTIRVLSGYFHNHLKQKAKSVYKEEKLHELLCPECDLLVVIPVLIQRQVASCPRCLCVLEKQAYYRVQSLLALVITGLLLYIPANIYPVLTLELFGRQHSSTIWGGVVALWSSGLPVVASLVFAVKNILLNHFSSLVGGAKYFHAPWAFVFVMLIPLLRLLMLLPVIWASLHQGGTRLSGLLFRDYLFLCQWGMAKIYMLGVLISAIKLIDMATVEAGLGVFCYTGLMLIEIAISLKLNEERLWLSLGKSKRVKVIERTRTINEWN